MMRMMSVMAIPSSYFVEYLCQFRILPLIAPFVFFALAFYLALPFSARQVLYGALDPWVNDSPFSLLPPVSSLADRPFSALCYAAKYHENAYLPPQPVIETTIVYFTIRLFFTDMTPLTLLVISPAFLEAS